MMSALTYGFNADERQPVTGSAIQRDGMAVAKQVAAATATYNSIYINNPAHRRAVQAIVEVNEQGLAAPDRAEVKSLLLTGPSAAGKTSAIKQAIDAIESDRSLSETAGELPMKSVVYVAIDVGATNRRIWTAVLEAVGNTFVERSTEEKLRSRAYKLMKAMGITLIVFDEVQHLARSNRAKDVTDVFKRILDDGVVPLILVGTEDACRMFQGNVQIANRMVTPCELKPFDFKVDDEVHIFRHFLARLDAEMLRRGLVTSQGDLGSERISQAIMHVSGGILGRAVNLIREALAIMVRREGEKIEVYDLHRATEQWALPLRIATHNAFVTPGTA